ncbi:MAG: HAD family hydrolase, partial [Planctomycetota bacterium]
MTLTVLFDVDGTLVCYPSVGRRARARALAEEWGIPRALDGVLFAGATDTRLLGQVASGRPRDAVWERYLRHLRSDLAALPDPVPLPGVTALLDRLAAAGTRLGLLTGNVADGARLKLLRSGLWGRFDPSISAFAEDGEPRTE